jgi:hypothetical protein
MKEIKRGKDKKKEQSIQRCKITEIRSRNISRSGPVRTDSVYFRWQILCGRGCTWEYGGEEKRNYDFYG